MTIARIADLIHPYRIRQTVYEVWELRLLVRIVSQSWPDRSIVLHCSNLHCSNIVSITGNTTKESLKHSDPSSCKSCHPKSKIVTTRQRIQMRILSVKVKPNSKQQSIRQEADGSFTVHLKSPPVDGKANQELIQVLAKELDLPKSSIRIKAGATSKSKLIEIEV